MHEGRPRQCAHEAGIEVTNAAVAARRPEGRPLTRFFAHPRYLGSPAVSLPPSAARGSTPPRIDPRQLTNTRPLGRSSALAQSLPPTPQKTRRSNRAAAGGASCRSQACRADKAKRGEARRGDPRKGDPTPPHTQARTQGGHRPRRALLSPLTKLRRVAPDTGGEYRAPVDRYRQKLRGNWR